ncbi:MAG: hypothetical protein GX219_02795 [Tissierellia bacterium]|nr:hypothetical protein [Tissierellia bacterium]
MKHKLFVTKMCPFCKIVERHIKKNDLEEYFEIIDINEKANLDEYKKISTVDQVPCLVVDGKPMYESLDIIKWIKNTYKKIK